MGVQGVNGTAVAAASAGALLIWSGIKGASVTGSLRSLISGRPPPGRNLHPVAGTEFSGVMPGDSGLGAVQSAPAGATGSALADAGLRYVGKPYHWAGGNPNTGADCSGLVNYAACHDQRLPIPGYRGGTFTGATHGPGTITWLAWAPGHMQRVKSGAVVAGDLVIWQSHMGIAISGTRYVSAFDTAEGVVVHNIHGGGPVGEVATFWRYPVARTSA